MLKLCTGLLLATSLMAPTLPNNANPKPLPKGPLPTKKKPTKKPAKKPAQSQPDDFAPSEYQGTVTSIRVNKKGDIQHFYFKLVGNVRSIRIKGCGAKSAAHPLLNWAFTENRVISVVTGDGQCMRAVTVSKK